MNTCLTSERVLLPEGIRPAAIWIGADGRISKIQTENLSSLLDDQPDAQRLSGVLAPGFVDTHAHINEPGRTEWEGFETASQAALAGGITTVIDMPLNSLPPTVSLAALHEKAKAAAGKTWIDYGFWGGIIPANANQPTELKAMVQDGVLGFKAFMIDSGVPEFPWSNREVLLSAMKHLAALKVPLLVHAEIDLPVLPRTSATPHPYAHYLASRPKEWENQAITLIIELSRQTNCPVHIVHLSSAESINPIAAAKKSGIRITAETCPHYLYWNAETIPAGATEFKCAPPIREEQNRQALLKGLKDGIIDFVVSDHSPCTPGLKLKEKGDFDQAWGGIASLQFSFSATWTALSEFGFTLEETLRLMTRKTAHFAGIEKGEIREGRVADLVEIDPDAMQVVSPEKIFHRHKVTPYLGKTLRGVVHRTWLHGELKWEQRFIGSPTGQRILRKEFL